MRNTKNLWKYVSIEIFLAGAYESEYLKGKDIETYGRETKIGFGRSPKQAKENAKITYIGNCDLTPILGDNVYFLNGKEKIRTIYSDNLINANGEIRV